MNFATDATLMASGAAVAQVHGVFCERTHEARQRRVIRNI